MLKLGRFFFRPVVLDKGELVGSSWRGGLVAAVVDLQTISRDDESSSCTGVKGLDGKETIVVTRKPLKIEYLVEVLVIDKQNHSAPSLILEIPGEALCYGRRQCLRPTKR